MLNTLATLGFPMLLLAFVVIILVQGASPVSRFVKAGAFSTQTARRPVSVGVQFPETIYAPLRKGVLVSTGDGRYFVDLQVLNAVCRRNRRIIVAMSVVVVALAVFTLAL